MSKSMIEETTESVVENKHPIGKVIPGSPFVIVALTYLGILALSLALLGIAWWVIQ